MLQVTWIAPFLAVSDSTILLNHFASVHVVYLSHGQFPVHVKRIAIPMSYTLPHYQYTGV